MKCKLLVFYLSLLIALSGCRLIKFETPEEQWQREQNALSGAEVEKPRPSDFLTDDLTYSHELTNHAGKLLARYEAKMPQFSSDNDYAVIFERINEYYHREIASTADDAEGFFQTVKAQYGEEWSVVETIDEAYTVDYGYRLLDSGENYICFVRTYVFYSPKGAGYTANYPDVFLAENGWRLDFDELFGSRAEQARARVLTEIVNWCAANSVQCEKLAELEAEDFVQNYALDSENMIFFAPPFMLSTNDKNSYEITIDLALFADLFVDSAQN